MVKINSKLFFFFCTVCPYTVLLFLIYVNDLLALNLSGEIICFADDTTLLYSGYNHNDLNSLIQNDLIKLKSWFDSNDLNINANKTKYMNFSLIKKVNPFRLIYHNDNCNDDLSCACQELECVDSIKYLGLHIDSNLKWKSHINSISNTMRFYLYKFYHLKHLVDKKFLKQLYYAWVHPRIYYGLSIWGGDYETNISAVKNLQNKFIKIILNYKNQSITFQDYTLLDILPVQELHFYKNCYNLFLNPNLCVKRDIVNPRRPNIIYNVPRANREIFHKCFFYLAPKQYNSLPVDLQVIQNVIIFKKNLKNYLLSVENFH